MEYELAVLVPITTRGLKIETIRDLPLFKYFFPSFENTLPRNVKYKIFVGMDFDDPWINEIGNYIDKYYLSFEVVPIYGCKGKPAWIWNLLAKRAFESNARYLLQVGDDIEILSPGWWECFTEVLSQNLGVGVAGFYDKKMDWRREVGLPLIVENSLVHRTHFEIFNTYFAWELPNWYCDDWLTNVYKPFCCFQSSDYCTVNHVRDNRYQPVDIAIGDLIDTILEGRSKVKHWIWSKCQSL